MRKELIVVFKLKKNDTNQSPGNSGKLVMSQNVRRIWKTFDNEKDDSEFKASVKPLFVDKHD